MKKYKDNRSVFEYILFSVFTCGIYAIWFQYTMVCDINEMLADEGKPTTNLPMRLVWTLLTCTLYDFWWRYTLAERLRKALEQRRHIYSVSGGWQVFFSLIGRSNPIFLWVADHKLISATNQLAKIHNESQYVIEDEEKTDEDTF